MVSITVAATNDALLSKAQRLAAELRLPLMPAGETNDSYCLLLTDLGLELRAPKSLRLNPLRVDFLHGANAHRQQYGGGRGQLIARAVGLRTRSQLSVVDATAGLGRDGFVLATLGCQVTLIERSPIVAALLADGLKRLQQDSNYQKLSLQLIIGEAKQFLAILPPADVAYLDPMFPERTKSALVKKEMRMLKQVVGDDIDSVELFKVAQTIAKQRVVVKRAKLAPTLTEQKPDLVFAGKSTRFDVYLTKL